MISTWPSQPRQSSHKALKPKFLQDVEDFLERELLVCSSGGGHDQRERLQVFRQVYAMLIEDFTVYKPLLVSIQDEYEQSITRLQVCQRVSRQEGDGEECWLFFRETGVEDMG